jgi:hypothetical protein
LPYSIYTSSDISVPLGAWTQLTTGGTLSGATDNFTDPNGGTAPQQFYMITSP